MPSTDLRCSSCSKPLALADKACANCGTPVPPALRTGVLVARAEQQAEAGQYAEAARSLELLLGELSEAKGDKLLWRKRGSWLLRSGKPELMDAAESAFAEALRLDDNDDLSHQLWMDLLNRRGHGEKARAWYEQRLQLNAEDAMAKRQLAILRLTADFKAAPLPKLDIPAGREGLLFRMVKPTPYKLVMAGAGALFALGALISALFAGQDAAVTGDAEMGSIINLAMDPWVNGIQAMVFGAYVVWGWFEMKRG